MLMYFRFSVRKHTAFAALRKFSSDPKVAKKTLPQLVKEVDVRGKPVLLRADLNLPRSKEDGSITDDTRARAVCPFTWLNYVLFYLDAYQGSYVWTCLQLCAGMALDARPN